jgi:hypothetical protein
MAQAASDRRNPLDAPSFWLAALIAARERRDFVRARRATAELQRLGVAVTVHGAQADGNTGTVQHE